MADVWVARKTLNQKNAKIVALKLIADHFVGDERYIRMFRAEAELAAGLSHANIVQVFDEGEEDGRSYLVMEWVDGPNLLKLGDMLAFLGEERRRFRVISYVIGQLLYALDYAHSITTHDGSPMGVVHRDVSPQNVLVSNHGEVKLTDFGVACQHSERSSGIHVKGKVRYMAPEQLSGKTRAPTIDLYAVGAILHELVDGRKFRGDHEDGQDLFSVVLSGQIPTLSRPIPPELDQLRLRLLEPDPARRIQTAEQALALLKRYPDYGDARDELTKLCRHLTGIARPRTAPGQSSKVPAADQATTRWGGRQALARPRVGARPAMPPAPPPAKLVRGSAPRTGSTTAVKDARATSRALITGSTVVMEVPALPLLQGNAAMVAPGTQVIDPSMIIAVEPNVRGESDVSFHRAAGDGSDLRGAHVPPASPARADSVSIVLSRGMAATLLGFGLAMIAAVSVFVTWILVERGQVAANEGDPGVLVDGSMLRKMGAGAVPMPEEPVHDARPASEEQLAPGLPPELEPRPEPAPAPVQAPPATIDANRASEAEEHVASRVQRGREPPAKLVGPAWVKLRRSTDLEQGQLRIGSKTFGLNDPAEQKLSAGAKRLEWRKDPDDPWRTASSATFRPGKHYIIHVGKNGPKVRLAQ